MDHKSYKQLQPSPTEQRERLKKWTVTLILLAVVLWSAFSFPFEGIKETAGKIASSILSGFIHPDLSYVWTGDGEDLISILLLTVAIAFLGTFISAILSLPFAFWAARTKMKNGIISDAGKLFLSFVRTFPEIVLALMFIKAVGPGSFAGVLAVGFHSIGMLAKLFSEAIENLDTSANEAIISSGGSKTNVTFFSVLPQLMPELISNTLFRFELAIRSASILGIVGAGGIGTPLIFAIQTRSWERVGIILIGVIIMVTLVDGISGMIRKRLV